MNSSQESPEAQTPSPISHEHIRCAPGVLLSTPQLDLLAQAFHDAELIFVKREFRSGYSGALVLLVSLGAERAPVVVKLAHPLDLQREYQAYQQFVRQISPQNIAHLQGEPLLSADGQLGLIEYSFAGGDSHQAAASLQDYYEAKGGQACATILNRIFRAYGRYWWANNRPTLYTLGEQYDRLLPVHLQVGLLPGNALSDPHATANMTPDSEPAYILEPGKTSIVTLRQINEGEVIRLVGFQVAKISVPGQQLTLVAAPPPNEASAPLRIRLELDEPLETLLAYRIGDTIAQLDAVVTATRLRLICRAAEDAVPGYDPYVEQFVADDVVSPPETLHGVTQLNPLYDLSGLLDRVIETKASIIHGDLNLQNVLVDTPTGFAWIIDFGETRRGPTLLDLQRLEVQVITKLLPDAVRAAQLSPTAVAEMLVALHADHLPSAPPHEGLYEPFQVLSIIRRLARQYMIDDLDWDEYYLGLVITLLGALKYDELDNLARTLALVAGATARGLLGQRLEVGHQSPLAAATPAAQEAAPSTAPVAVGAPTAHAASTPAATTGADALPTPEPGAKSRLPLLRIGVGVLAALILVVVVWQMGWVPGVGAPEAGQTPESPPTTTAELVDAPDAPAELSQTVNLGISDFQMNYPADWIARTEGAITYIESLADACDLGVGVCVEYEYQSLQEFGLPDDPSFDDAIELLREIFEWEELSDWAETEAFGVPAITVDYFRDFQDGVWGQVWAGFVGDDGFLILVESPSEAELAQVMPTFEAMLATAELSDDALAVAAATEESTPDAPPTDAGVDEAIPEDDEPAAIVPTEEPIDEPIEDESPVDEPAATPTPQAEEPTPTPASIDSLAARPTATPVAEVLHLAAWEGEVDRNNPDYIRSVQAALNQILGLDLAVDGVMGPATRTAIGRFQLQEGLTPDSIVGPETETALLAALSASEQGATVQGPPPGYMAGDTWQHPVDDAVYVFVPEGAFEMGLAGEGAELQPHTVHVSDFWIMQTEVTNAQYRLCVDADVCTPPGNDNWTDSDYADHPVTDVTWEQANAYARWVGGRLPTEAEWEKAARGTDGRIYPWGDERPDDELLNFNLSMLNSTAPVGSYPEGASPYGALDMAGNVEEWVADWHDPNYYAESPERDPTGPEEGARRVLRGGSYTSNVRVVRAVNREPALPGMRLPYIGFRVAISP